MTAEEFKKLTLCTKVVIIAGSATSQTWIVDNVGRVGEFVGFKTWTKASTGELQEGGEVKVDDANHILGCRNVIVNPDNVILAAPKKDSNFPHKCPMCHGPAYLGFNVRVDCKGGCYGTRKTA